MLYVVLFLLFALACAALTVLLGGPVWLAAAVFVTGFVLAHLIFVLVFRLLSRGTNLSRPGEKQNRFTRRGAEALGQILCLYGGVRPVLSGLEKLPESERFLFVCNHRSLFDPLIVMGFLGKWNIAFISKPSNMQIPLVGAAARTAGFLAIDRENDRAALRTILTAADYIKRGVCSIGIYPEGTRSRDGALLPFHSGSFKIAQRAKCPLVIACVHGTEKAGRGLFLCPRRAYLEILETLPAEQVGSMSTQALAEHSRALIEARLKEVEGA